MDSSSKVPASFSFSRPNLDLAKWVDSIRTSMNVAHDDKTTNTEVCIFSVPKILLDTDPYSYIPQLVALGPIHQWHPNVYDMQKYKLAAAKITQNRRNVKFERIVEIIKGNDEPRIRACYHKFLDVDSDTLAWMMAIDMAFLIEFLHVCYVNEHEGDTVLEIASRLSSVVDVSRRKLSHRMILRDVVKLENQIPLFLIKTMLEHDQRYDQNTERSAKDTLNEMLMGLYDELSPFQYRPQTALDIDKCNHLLGFLYQMTVPNHTELGIVDEVTVETSTVDGVDAPTETNDGEKEEHFSKPSNLKQAFRFIWKIITQTNFALARFLKKILFLKPITFVLKLPWTIISRLPVLRLLKEPIENMIGHFIGKQTERFGDGNAQPLIAEIEIPSVTQMAKAGIVFSPVLDTISGLCFDEKTSTLYLPVLDLNGNTKVYLQNLVAYEACIATGPLVMARYTELMNGIIDTAKDAKFLMDRKIVVNHLKTDKDAADLWNGMSKCVRTTRVRSLDKVIEEVNKRYHRTWSVKLGKLMNKYVFGSWRFLTFLAAVFLLLLSTVQTFCSVYTCARVIKQLPQLDQPE